MRLRILKSCGILLPALFGPALCAQSPVGVSVVPSTGSGAGPQAFAFTAASPNGYADIAWIQVIFNYGIASPGACYFYFTPGNNLIYLNSDDGGVTSGNGWVGSAYLGASGTLQNSQCSMDLSSASFSGSADNLTLNLTLTFKPGLPGPQGIFMAVGDNGGLVSNWTQLGTWTGWPLSNPGQGPTLVSASPSSGGGGVGAWQTFTYTASSPNGVVDILQLLALMNTSVNGAGACYVLYFPQQNAIYLFNDAGTSATFGAPGSSGTLTNSQCTLNLGASSAVTSGNSLTLNVALTFASSFAGAKNQYMYVEDRQSNVAGWASMGAWTVSATPAAAPVFTPDGGIYSASLSIALSSATPGANIRYTTDGSAPTETHGTVYASPISVTTQTTINAIAYEQGWSDSPVTAETYYFSNPTGGNGSGNGNGVGSGPPPNTPPADSGNGLDPRRVGIRAPGSYWGDAGENIDTDSGNLNFASTLIKPFGRGNWTLPFMLSYNSQMWRHDSGGDWLLGQDVGYGMGWKLQAGSLTPVWASTSAIDHYIYTDASGSEYSLSVNTNGVWTSLEGIYISYDSNANKLYNTDGSFWVMGCTSSGTEQDAGTMYPTLAENSNGNQITINYAPAQGMGSANTSARITSVVDTRGTYSFSYSTLNANDDVQHLTSIVSPVAGEGWIFAYANSNLSSPISGASYGAVETLSSLQSYPSGGPPPAVFSYNGGAELTQYVTPLGGSISWGYRDFIYAGNITLREVNTRSMNQGAGGFTNTHTISRSDATDSGLTYHYLTVIYDNGAATQKNYYNLPAASGSSLIVPTYYQEAKPGVAATPQKNYGWAQTPAGNTYMSVVYNILDASLVNATYSVTSQTLDNYGNLTQQQVYDYGASAVTRTYNLSYLTDPNYASRHILNRLSGAAVTANNATILLAENAYDGTTLGLLQTPTGYTATNIPQHDSAYDATVAYRGNVTSAWKMGTTAQYAYDIAGNPYKARDGDGMTIAISTDSSTAASLPSALTPNSNSNLMTSLTYSSSYAPTSVTGPNGATQSMSYDAYNRPSSSTSTDGAITTYSYAYGPNTQTASVINTCPPATQCAQGQTAATQWKTTTYDGFGRAIKVQTGHDSTVVNTADTGYGACGCSPLGKVVKVSLPYGPGETEVWTTYTYDASGRQLTSTAPDGSLTTTSYLANSVTTSDPAGIWKTNVMDAFGNISAVSEPDPATGSASTGPATSYAYNGANQLIGVSMTRGGVTQTRTFTYSGSDLTSETTPEAGSVTYTYDGNHHVTTRVDAKNQKTAYTYDGYERLTLVQHFTWGPAPNCYAGCPSQWNEQAQQDVSYYYDTPVANDYTQNYTWGRLTAVSFQAQDNGSFSNNFAYEYSYNQAGRVTGNRMVMSQGAAFLDLRGQYAWDNQGRMTSLTYPSGPVMTYQFDAMGRPIAMTEAASASPGAQTWTAGSATYGSAGQILTVGATGPVNGAAGTASLGEQRTYNSMLQLVHLTSTVQSYTGVYVGGSVDMQYIYNTGHNNGRVSQTIDNVLGETVNYTYDYLHRLTAATATNGTWGEAYAYDGFGNLTSKTPTVGSAPAYIAAVNPATNAPSAADANGDLINTGVTSSVQWDVENRLAATTPVYSGNTVTYVYDPWGRRIWKQGYNPSTQVYAYEAFFYGATGQKLESYSCGYGSDGGLSATLEGINTYFAGKMLSEKGVFVATDRLGSVRADSNGVSVGYFPWGEERGQGTADDRTKFAGYYRDAVGQDYAMARYYSASSGSFWSPDPGGITTAYPGDPSRWNRYAYVSGDPVNKTDPSGFCSPQDNPPCFPVNSAPLPAGPTPGSPVQGNGGDAPPVDLGGDNPDPPGGGQDPSAVYTAALFSAFAALKDPACAAIFNTNPNSPNQYDPGAVLASMAFGGTAAGIPSGTYFGSIGMAVLPFSMAAITQPDRGSFTANGAGGIALSADIVLQGSTLAPGYYGNDTPQQLAMTLIHELGHVFNEVYGLGGSSIVYDALPNGRPNPRAEKQNAKTLANCHPQ